MSYEKLQSGSRERKLATRAASKNLVSPKQAKRGETVVARQYARDLTSRPSAGEAVEVESDEAEDKNPWWLYSTLGRGAE